MINWEGRKCKKVRKKIFFFYTVREIVKWDRKRPTRTPKTKTDGQITEGLKHAGNKLW